ncbi:MAG TPA: hypothetical protein VN845_05970 [Solirubrobacteraceae bacterium]|nr:hypothetical protein [Solirubrobacteraceae bacterium]
MILLLSGLAISVVTSATATPARASWGKGECYESESAHCYAYTEWEMTHAGESVKGAEDIPDTTLMDVPEYANGSFVDDEMWLGFSSSEGWLEIGQEAGSNKSCCTLHPFIAHAEYRNSSGHAIGYEEYTWNEVDAEPRNLYRIEDPSANGTWCEYIWNNLVDCHAKPGYWSTYANELEAGMEVYANSKPTNAGSQEVDYIAHGGEHRAWGGASEVHGYISPGPNAAHELCESPNKKSNYPGNAEWSTC